MSETRKMGTALHAAVTAALVVAITVPDAAHEVDEKAQAAHVQAVIDRAAARRTARFGRHFSPGNMPAPVSYDVFTRPYIEGHDEVQTMEGDKDCGQEDVTFVGRVPGRPGDTYYPQRAVHAPKDAASFYLHTRGPKAGKYLAHKGEWTYQELEYAKVHGLVLQSREERRGRDRKNAINRREALKRLLAKA